MRHRAGLWAILAITSATMVTGCGLLSASALRLGADKAVEYHGVDATGPAQRVYVRDGLYRASWQTSCSEATVAWFVVATHSQVELIQTRHDGVGGRKVVALPAGLGYLSANARCDSTDRFFVGLEYVGALERGQDLHTPYPG